MLMHLRGSRFQGVCHSSIQPMGGDLGETGGTVPPKFEFGGGPCIRPPNILRSSVVGCARKYEKCKKGVIKELFSEIGFFLVKKGSLGLYNISHSKDM